MSVLSVILRDRNVEVSKSAMIICNSAHAYGLLYLSLKGKVAIYLMAWAIAILLADGSFHNLYPVISNSPTLFH